MARGVRRLLKAAEPVENTGQERGPGQIRARSLLSVTGGRLSGVIGSSPGKAGLTEQFPSTP
jgi:hypothetical protein